MSLYFRHLRGAFAGLALTSVSTFALAGNPAAPTYTPNLLPANPQSGECYARIEVPAQYRTDSETVLIQEGYTTLDVSQPQITTRQEDVLVKEASVRYEVRQPTFRTVTEKIMTRPAYERLSVTAPQFTKQRETIKISNARLIWKKGNPSKLTAQGYKVHSTADTGFRGQGYGVAGNHAIAPEGAMRCGSTCEIWCLVEEPAKHVTYDRKVLSQASEVRRVPVSAKYASITKQVVADRGGVKEIPVPAQYRSIMMETVDPGYGTREVQVPAQYGSIGKKVMTSPSRHEWRRVVCLPGTHPNARRTVSSRGAHGVRAGNYTSSSHVTPTQTATTKSYTTHKDLSGYSRSHQTRGYEDRNQSSSRHQFTIPARGYGTALPTPVKAEKTVSKRGTSKTRQEKRSKHRNRNW